MKRLLLHISLVLVAFCNAQQNFTISSQSDRLKQYSGNWVSSINPFTDSITNLPEIKMSCTRNFSDNLLEVKVFQKNENNEYIPLLNELIGFDNLTDTIFASGFNAKEEFFIGKGAFTSEKKWVMYDKDLDGNPIMRVDFKFQNYTDVILEGFDNDNQSLWKTRYIKNNPKNKNIGIQLVSVHDNMLKNPQKTLIQLGRMGYSYVETFVYEKGSFYGQSPEQFKAMVEKAGMQFLGSMTFFDPENKNDDAIITNWWNKTIKDHKAAGVEYLSTSNNNIKNIKTITELQAYCDYYNKIGQLCKDNDLKFVFHNHADEFLTIEGVRVYDYFLQNTNPEHVFFQTDLYWMHVAGVNPTDYFKKYPNRFISWHVKDYKELGDSGEINFKDIFKYQDESTLKYIVSEVEDYSFPPMFSIGLAWEYIYYDLLN